MRFRIFLLAVVTISFMAVLLFAGIRTGAITRPGLLSHLPSAAYRIDASESKFMVHASRGGLAWFKGHSHNIAVRNFEGTAELKLDALNPASLTMSVRADSLEETDPIFSPAQKEIINKELDEIVLESAKYPEISFKSTAVTANLLRTDSSDVKITGDLTLHGVTRSIEIPATVSVNGDVLRASGRFEIDRKDFNVRAPNAFYGMVRVKHDLRFEFDIVAKRIESVGLTG